MFQINVFLVQLQRGIMCSKDSCQEISEEAAAMLGESDKKGSFFRKVTHLFHSISESDQCSPKNFKKGTSFCSNG